MSQELTKANAGAVVAVSGPTPGDMLQIIARAASDPSVDVAKMSALVDLQERLMKLSAEQRFNADLVGLQGRIPQIGKDGRIEVKGELRSKYSRLETIDAVLRPLMQEYGFALTFDSPTLTAGAMQFQATLRHRDGHSKPYAMTLPVDSSGSKNGTQGGGSTTSYARRYLICAIFNVITRDEDNDGNGDPVSKDPITDQQYMTIEDLITHVGAKKPALLKWVSERAKREIPELRAIPASEYEAVVKAIKDFGRKKGMVIE